MNDVPCHIKRNIQEIHPEDIFVGDIFILQVLLPIEILLTFIFKKNSILLFFTGSKIRHDLFRLMRSYATNVKWIFPDELKKSVAKDCSACLVTEVSESKAIVIGTGMHSVGENQGALGHWGGEHSPSREAGSHDENGKILLSFF